MKRLLNRTTIWRKTAKELGQKIIQATDTKERIEIIEDFLLDKLKGVKMKKTILSAAIILLVDFTACTNQNSSNSQTQKTIGMKQKIESVTIGIAVKNDTEAAKWYKSLLGDVEIMKPTPGIIELKLTDNTWLQLDDTGDLEVGRGSSIVRLETKDIDAAHERVKKLTSDVEDIVSVKGVVKFFGFKDPAGNRLSYYQLL